MAADRGRVPLGLSAYVVSSASAKGVLHAQMFDPLAKRSAIRKIAFTFKPGASS